MREEIEEEEVENGKKTNGIDQQMKIVKCSQGKN